jgi:topoisomerase-4 subunit A
MKAMGNRLSQHLVKSVELIATPEAEEEETPIADNNDGADEAEIITDVKPDEGDDTDGDIEAGNDEPDDKPVPPAPAESPKEKPVEPASQPRKVDFEITNPDDIDIDDKGQLGLF